MLERIQNKHPLIHSITSPIAINDCANAVLAVGAQPIMAEHPQEVADITSIAKALTLSLANITDARMKSIMISGLRAQELQLPSLIDIVGVTCSPMRMDFARSIIQNCRPTVIKGNYTEIRAIAGAEFDRTSGIDVGEKDSGSGKDLVSEMEDLVLSFAARSGCIIIATGAVDLIADPSRCTRVYNGHPRMARITGTGCILSCITGAFLAAYEPYEAVVNAVLTWCISGELAYEQVGENSGLGSYHVALMDALSLMTEDIIQARRKIEVIS